jgi:hypothetical protein
MCGRFPNAKTIPVNAERWETTVSPGFDAMGVEDVAAAVRFLLSLSPRCAVDVLHLRRSGAEPFAV